VKKAIFWQKIANISETVRYRTKVTTKCGYKLVHSLSTGDIFDDVTWPVSKFKRNHLSRQSRDKNTCLETSSLV